MDQIKIGNFIASLRKEQGLTQAQLAEMLGITDRAVSKWERGRSLPDSSLMLELCEILKINVNELLSGERLDNMDSYNENLEKNLIEMTKQKEESDRKMLRLEWVIGFSSSATFMILIFSASFITMPGWVRVLLISSALLIFAVGMVSALSIEQTAGYYECQHCHHKYVPKFMPVFLAMHMGRTRYMKCPKCKKRSWQKKVINK